MFKRRRGSGGSRKHTCNLLHARLPVNRKYLCGSTVPLHTLLYLYLSIGINRNTCKMGDAQNLFFLRKKFHMATNRHCDFTAYSSVYFIKHKRIDCVSCGKYRLEREHDAAYFTAGSDLCKRHHRRAGICCDEEFYVVHSVRSAFLSDIVTRLFRKVHLELGVLHAELCKNLFYFERHLLRRGRTFCVDAFGCDIHFLLKLCNFLFERRLVRSAARQSLKFSLGFLCIRKYFCNRSLWRRGIFFLEFEQKFKTLLNLRQTLRIKHKRRGILLEFFGNVIYLVERRLQSAVEIFKRFVKRNRMGDDAFEPFEQRNY